MPLCSPVGAEGRVNMPKLLSQTSYPNKKFPYCLDFVLMDLVCVILSILTF